MAAFAVAAGRSRNDLAYVPYQHHIEAYAAFGSRQVEDQHCCIAFARGWDGTGLVDSWSEARHSPEPPYCMGLGGQGPVVAPCRTEHRGLAASRKVVVQVVSSCRLMESGYEVVECPRAVLSRNSTRLAKQSLRLLDPLPLGIRS